MSIIDIIATKRDGGELSTEQIQTFITEYTAGDIADYQASALAMAIYIHGMSRRETVDLTLAIANSGDQLDLHDVAPFIVDKHSSGGVGDKTTLVVQPIVAACGVPVGKMSGRGLGSSGGTLDKLESISGWSFRMPLEQFKKQLGEIGIVLAGQTADLAPADGKLYALRDVTATVSSLPLISASIMSKKLASGADGILLDVKVGNGAFMATLEDATQLAEIMVGIGTDAGRKVTALISDMNQPLGHAIGNALEVQESIATLHGNGPADFWEHCQVVSAEMLRLAGRVETLEEGKRLAATVVEDGSAFIKFRSMVAAQGGDSTQIDNPSTLPKAAYKNALLAPQSGYISGFQTNEIGWISVRLGAGRVVKADQIDHAVGLVIPIKVGDFVEKGQTLAVIHANDEAKLAQAKADLLPTIQWSDDPVEPLPKHHGFIQVDC